MPNRESRSGKLLGVLLPFFVGGLGLTMLAGCTSQKQKAREVIEGYIVADTVAQEAQKLRYLAEPDRRILRRKLASPEVTAASDKLVEIARESFGDRLSVDIESIEATGDATLHVTARITRPERREVSEVMMRRLSEISEEYDDRSDADKNRALAEALRTSFEQETFALHEEAATFELHRESDGWRLFRDLKAKREAASIIESARELIADEAHEEARRKLRAAEEIIEDDDFDDLREQVTAARVTILEREARRHRIDGDYERAIGAYEKIVDLAPEPDSRAPIAGDEAREFLEDLETQRERREAQRAYRDRVAVEDVTLEDSYAGPHLTGRLVNHGEQRLAKVELSIEYLDGSGATLRRATRTPVRAIGDDQKGLGPGESESFEAYPSKLPEMPSRSVEVTVEGVRFFGESW